MYPMKLKAAFKDYLWGGTRLRTEYHMQSDLAKLAEAWVLSCHKDGPSVVENGEYAGLTLEEGGPWRQGQPVRLFPHPHQTH